MNPYPNGSVVRVKDPDNFVSTFANKVRDRDAIVKDSLLDWTGNNERAFRGRLLIEFQKRGNRGKTFTDVLHQRHLTLTGEAP